MRALMEIIFFAFISIFLVTVFMNILPKNTKRTFPIEDKNYGSKNIQTIFYQGKGSTQTQASKYVGRHGFTSPTTGERIIHLEGIDLIQNLFIGKELDEIELFDYSEIYFSPIKCFKFLMGGMKHWWNKIKVYNQEENNTTTKTLFYFSIHNDLVSIGGKTDLIEHKKKYDLWRENYPNDDSVILFGVSRGAATTFSAMAEYNYDKVSLVILEGFPVHFKKLLLYNYGYFLGNFIYKFLKWWYPNFNPDKNKQQPWDRIHEFPKNVPVVFISSLKDELTPHLLIDDFIKEFSASRNGSTYFITLIDAYHSNYATTEFDKIFYFYFIHSLYKHLGLPHRELEKYLDVNDYLVHH